MFSGFPPAVEYFMLFMAALAVGALGLNAYNLKFGSSKTDDAVSRARLNAEMLAERVERAAAQAHADAEQIKALLARIADSTK